MSNYKLKITPYKHFIPQGWAQAEALPDVRPKTSTEPAPWAQLPHPYLPGPVPDAKPRLGASSSFQAAARLNSCRVGGGEGDRTCQSWTQSNACHMAQDGHLRDPEAQVGASQWENAVEPNIGWEHPHLLCLQTELGAQLSEGARGTSHSSTPEQHWLIIRHRFKHQVWLEVTTVARETINTYFHISFSSAELSVWGQMVLRIQDNSRKPGNPTVWAFSCEIIWNHFT